jgi:hypothetical protein
MSGKTYLRNQKYFKPNYFEAIKYILPEYLYEDDITGTPKADDVADVIINSHLDTAANFSSIIHVSAVGNSVYSSIDTLEGIAPFFIKQNELTNITTTEFEDEILTYFNKTFKGFETVSDFESFVSDTLLPAITLNSPDSAYFGAIGSTSAIHNYLINKLSWMYFLNTSGATYDPSAYVQGLLVSSLFIGTPVKINDGIKGLSEHLWRNGLGDYYPSSLFAGGTTSHLSGTQQLEKLQTWVDVIYSPLYTDRSDFTVRDKFETFMDNSFKFTDKVESGPFARLIRSLSFLAYDINNQTEQISTLYDIEDCPDDYLPLIAQLIGWDLFGDDPNKWRLQLRNAVSIYKTIGTKKSIQATINTVFPKDQFPVETRITELWESYVPYLIYYALATESPYFKNYQSWPLSLAGDMDVKGYSTNDMDANIRMVVDKIILDTIIQFPDSFPINSWLGENEFVFNYRGRNYPIPPFEEYPYYVNVELSQPMVEFISDKLACFGVREQFALDVSSYITTTALGEVDEPRAGSWLLFTSGYNSPPNLDNLISNLNDNSFDYASLWSGKSSHFKLVLDASEFDFTKKGLNDIDSGDAVVMVSKAIKNSAPAHSIPLLSLELSGEPDLLSITGNTLPLVTVDRTEIDVGAGNNLFNKGINFNSYKRGINPGGNVIERSATQSLVSPEFLSASTTPLVARNSARRRSYEKVMPFNGYYDRTGFNMPVGFGMASSLSGIPLGLVPSSLSFTPVSSHINLPAIWAQCEGLQSNNSYYEYDVSNTQNTRSAYSTFADNKDFTTDRGQLPGIYAAMHRIKENQKDLETYLVSGPIAIQRQLDVATAASTITYLRDLLVNQTSGILQSYTNGFSNSSIEGYTFPASQEDYYNFEFGRDLHRFYHEYKNNFKWHRLSPDVQEQDGANIFSHTFGPLLYNHDFEDLGSVTDLVASSFASPAKITVDSGPFTGVGSFVASAGNSMYLDTFERVASGIIEGVELVLTSGTAADSSFSIIKVPGSQRAFYEDPFLFDKTLVIMRSGNGAATRVRFDISKYAARSPHPISNNFLSPEHDFKATLNSVISRDSGLTVGGKSVNVWIHTKPESDMMWSFTPEGKWVQHSQLVTRPDLFSKYAHSKLLTLKTNDTQASSTSSTLECIDQAGTNRNSPVLGLGASSFENFEVNFHTRNREIRVPKDYQSSHGQLHRLNQEYVVEVFMAPGAQPDEFMLVDNVKVQDLTLKTLSEIFAAGTKSDPLCQLSYFKYGCEEYRVELSKQDLFDVLKHFNNISGKNAAAVAYASRDKNKTETIMESEGGSRIDYRFSDAMVGGSHSLNPELHLEIIFYS